MLEKFTPLLLSSNFILIMIFFAENVLTELTHNLYHFLSQRKYQPHPSFENDRYIIRYESLEKI